MIRKVLIVFTILLNSICGSLYACGPYFPNGEDIRFNMLKPEIFKCYGFNAFNLSGHYYYEGKNSYDQYLYEGESLNPNIIWWQNRCNNIPTYEEINYALYENIKIFKSNITDNSFITYLYEHDTAALNYLKFLAEYEAFPGVFYDPWERPGSSMREPLSGWIDECLRKSGLATDADIKKRYAFLGLRSAFNYSDSNKVAQIFDDYFRANKSRDLIDYWAMHYYAKSTNNDIESNFYAALSFKNAPEKRLPVIGTFDRTCPQSSVLQLAKTPEERNAVYLMYALRNPGYSLQEIKKMYNNDPDDDALTFILLREINKLEFWIYTPYFFNYKPRFDISNDYWADSIADYGWRSLQNDKAYAKQMLDFVRVTDFNKVHDKYAWQFSKAYLQFMTGDYTGAELSIANATKSLSDTTQLFEQFEKLKLYVLVGLQTTGKPVITGKMQPLIERQLENQDYKYLFGLARLLEFDGNTTEAVLIMSHINLHDKWENPNAFWKATKRLKNEEGYYLTYLYYLDAQYSKQQIKNIIYAIENRKDTSAFGNWLYANVEKNKYDFYDLVGMKYMRINELEKAHYYFKSIPDIYWTTAQNYENVDFYVNPFDIGLIKNDTMHYTKAELLETLMLYTKKANNVNNKDRDYYNFLVANCYYNMTSYGNSWMMRRLFGGSRYLKDSKLEDMDEYYNCNIAKMYYLKAKSTSKSKQFSALALLFAGKCEKNRLTYLKGDVYLSDKEDKEIFDKNAYYHQLERKYPGYYQELMSNCESRRLFFNSR